MTPERLQHIKHAFATRLTEGGVLSDFSDELFVEISELQARCRELEGEVRQKQLHADQYAHKLNQYRNGDAISIPAAQRLTAQEKRIAELTAERDLFERRWNSSEELRTGLHDLMQAKDIELERLRTGIEEIQASIHVAQCGEHRYFQDQDCERAEQLLKTTEKRVSPGGCGMSVKMWLDDIRPAPPGWAHVRNYDEAVTLMEQLIAERKMIDVASLDHDLGGQAYNYCAVCREKVNSYDEWHNIFIHGCEHGERTGTHVVRWMESKGFWPKRIVIHSYNVEGAARMESIAKEHTTTIVCRYTGKEI